MHPPIPTIWKQTRSYLARQYWHWIEVVHYNGLYNHQDAATGEDNDDDDDDDDDDDGDYDDNL